MDVYRVNLEWITSKPKSHIHTREIVNWTADRSGIDVRKNLIQPFRIPVSLCLIDRTIAFGPSVGPHRAGLLTEIREIVRGNASKIISDAGEFPKYIVSELMIEAGHIQ